MKFSRMSGPLMVLAVATISSGHATPFSEDDVYDTSAMWTNWEKYITDDSNFEVPLPVLRANGKQPTSASVGGTTFEGDVYPNLNLWYQELPSLGKRSRTKERPIVDESFSRKKTMLLRNSIDDTRFQNTQGEEGWNPILIENNEYLPIDELFPVLLEAPVELLMTEEEEGVEMESMDINESNYEDILFEAVSRGNVDRVRDILADIAEADIAISKKQGHALLCEASRTWNQPVMLALLEAGANTNTACTQGKNQRSLIVKAVEHGDVTIVENLIEFGADPFARYNRQSCLRIAVAAGNEEMVRALIKNGVNARGDNAPGSPAIHTAVGNGHVGLVKLLLDAGADINQLYKKKSPLDVAMAKGDNVMTQLLLEFMSKK